MTSNSVGRSPSPDVGTFKRSAAPTSLWNTIADAGGLALWVLAVVSYFGPWIARALPSGAVSAALSWNAYDLFDLLRTLPEIESGALAVNLQTLQLPLLALVVLLPVLALRFRTVWSHTLARVGIAVLGSGLAALTLPPYPEIITAWRTPGWRVPFWWGVGTILLTWIAVWAAPKMGKARHWVCIAAVELAVLPAAATLARLLPALSVLHVAHIRPGWGFWGCAVGLGMIGVLAGIRALGVTDGEHPRYA